MSVKIRQRFSGTDGIGVEDGQCFARERERFDNGEQRQRGWLAAAVVNGGLGFQAAGGGLVAWSALAPPAPFI
jgi:hypothetical protein